MKNQLHPALFFILSIFPVAIFIYFFLSDLVSVHHQLSRYALVTWIGLIGFLLGIIIYSSFHLYKRIREKSFFHLNDAFSIFVLHSAFIISYFVLFSLFTPSTPIFDFIPNKLSFICLILLSPGAFAGFVIFSILTERTDKLPFSSSWLLRLFILPTIFYVSFVIIFPLIISQLKLLGFWFNDTNPFFNGIEVTAFIFHFGLIFLGLIFVYLLFLFVRFVYFRVFENNERSLINSSLFRLFFTLLLPIFGLYLNNYIFSNHSYDDSFSNHSGMFGNFNHVGFYFLATLTGIILTFSSFIPPSWTFFRFLLLSITFSYTLYFTLVFLPLIPLAALAILAFGLGGLMFVPFVLFIIHSFQLFQDYRFLRTNYSTRFLSLLYFFSLFIIPLIIFASSFREKAKFDEAFEYVLNPIEGKEYALDLDKLYPYFREVLEFGSRDRNSFYSNKSIPIIESVQSYLIFGHTSLFDNRFSFVYSALYGSSHDKIFSPLNENPAAVKPTIIGSLVSSEYDSVNGYWKSWVHLEIQGDERLGMSEYQTSFHLPDGALISNYYLDVNDRRKYGLLTERKAALLIYKGILRQMQDPGVIYMNSPNSYSLRVFPFSKSEIRRTGFQICHKEPFSFQIDQLNIQLASSSNLPQNPIEFSNGIYIPPSYKVQLPKVNRSPYFHFAIDCSRNAEFILKSSIQAIDSLLSAYPELVPNSKVSFVGYKVETYDLSQVYDIKNKVLLKNPTFEGGFFLDRLIKSIEKNSIQNPSSDKYPILVPLTRNFYNSVISNSYPLYKQLFPEAPSLFFHIPGRPLAEYSLARDFQLVNRECFPIHLVNRSVYVYSSPSQVSYFLDDKKEGSLIFFPNTPLLENHLSHNIWEAGLQLAAFSAYLENNNSFLSTDWHKAVYFSVTKSLLTCYTTFIVVETDAQQAELLRKQNELLSGNWYHSDDMDPMSMDEPLVFEFLSFILSLLLFGVAAYKLYVMHHLRGIK
ncbi:MAG: MSEP-CTERM sorting domain-containing protein [Chloroherpetonaceae bacterium]|nr:MSEP-CTERM sorting domain-containing protein [Chloroherpetonaceae bacterium]